MYKSGLQLYEIANSHEYIDVMNGYLLDFMTSQKSVVNLVSTPIYMAKNICIVHITHACVCKMCVTVYKWHSMPALGTSNKILRKDIEHLPCSNLN